MRVEYSKRAIADLRQNRRLLYPSGAPAVAEIIAARIQEVVARIAEFPLNGRAVAQRPSVRVALLRSYRYSIFYRVTGDAVRIVHVRHTSGRPY